MEKIERQERQGRQAFKESRWYAENIEREEGTTYTYDRADVRCTGKTGETYIVEVKNYNDPQHPRPYSKYPDYQIDWDKVDDLARRANEEGRTPLLYVNFDDCEILWEIDWETLRKRIEWKTTNEKGYAYGKDKRMTIQTHLTKEEAIWIRDKE